MTNMLFAPIIMRGLSIPNRITVSPMCQYSAENGVVGDWHLAHLGQFAQSGPGLIIVESTGVEPEGRITSGCAGLYDDVTENAFARIVDFIKSVGDSRIGIQLGHSGRKGSTLVPWEGGGLIESPDAWLPLAPSAVKYLPGWPPPIAMDVAALNRVRDAFVQAAMRADRAGFDLIELHVGHGYLLHQFLSPITNQRTDGYGGSSAARMRYPLEIFEAMRAELPPDKPVIVRVSVTDWIEGGWDMSQSIHFCQALKQLGCDMIDVTSGGLDQRQKITTGPGYQVKMSETIRLKAEIATMAVGQITDPIQAETILSTGQADMVALARGMLWEPRWAWKAAVALGEEITLPAPHARCNPALRAKPFVTRT